VFCPEFIIFLLNIMAVIILFVSIAGLFIGSFLNVLIDRLPKGEDVIFGRSRCDHCRRTLRWYELIPVLSFIIQKGRCLKCNKKLSVQYPLVELATACMYISIYYAYQNDSLVTYEHFISMLLWIVLASCMLVIFLSDLKYQIIPDSMVLISGISAILIQLYSIGIKAVIGNYFPAALASFVFFYLIWIITRHKGMGFGDVKLSFVIGLLLGYPLTIVAIYIAFLTGAIAGVILILTGKKNLKSRIAFGPFLVIGTLIAKLFSFTILHIWQSIM